MTRDGRGRGRSIDATLTGGGDVPPQLLRIFATPVLVGYQSSPYTQWVAHATGGTSPYTFALIGTYPDGITIDADTGVVSGTPTEDGDFVDLNVEVTDAAIDTDQLDDDFVIDITTELAISGTPVTTAKQNVAYAGFDVDASGGVGSYTFTIVGDWPNGIEINSGTGVVSGTTTEFGSFPTLTVRVADEASHTKSLSNFTINVVQELGIEGTPVLTATQDEAYAGFIASAIGGSVPIVYTLQGTWPDGITIDADTGEVIGTPTEDGSFASLSVRATDADTDTADLPSFTLVVEADTPVDPFAPWLPGASTTLSLSSGDTRIRFTKNDISANNPRAYREYTEADMIALGGTGSYELTTNGYLGTSGGFLGFYRIDELAGIPGSVYGSYSVTEPETPVFIPFDWTEGAGSIYVGLVVIVNAQDEYGELDFTVDLVKV